MKEIRYKDGYGQLRSIAGLLFTGVLDRNGNEIFAEDRLRFVDKWEWYRGNFGGGWLATKADQDDVLTDHEKYPYEERVVELPADYEWLLSKEIQTYWEIIPKTEEKHNG